MHTAGDILCSLGGRQVSPHLSHGFMCWWRDRVPLPEPLLPHHLQGHKYHFSHLAEVSLGSEERGNRKPSMQFIKTPAKCAHKLLQQGRFAKKQALFFLGLLARAKEMKLSGLSQAWSLTFPGLMLVTSPTARWLIRSS